MQRPDRLRIGRRLEWAYYVTEFMAEYIDLPPVNLPAIEFDFERNALTRPTVLASATQMLIDNRIKLPAQIAEDLVMNADDIESICALPSGTLQNKVVAFKFYQ